MHLHNLGNKWETFSSALNDLILLFYRLKRNVIPTVNLPKHKGKASRRPPKVRKTEVIDNSPIDAADSAIDSGNSPEDGANGKLNRPLSL